MLNRKIQTFLNEYFKSDMKKVLIIDGARQVGKSYIIRHESKAHFKNFVEVNMINDRDGARIFADLNGLDDFYVRLSSYYGKKLGTKKDTLIFLDEIQAYPELLTMLKFLCDDGRFNYIASGSLLGVTLHKTLSIPGGRIEVKHLYPLDFEEFLWANGVGEDVIAHMHGQFMKHEGLNDGLHRRLMDLFKSYLLVGGLPQAVSEFVSSQNIYRVRKIHDEIHNLYKEDASQYSRDERLKIRRVYDLIPSNMENRKKRLYFNSVEQKRGKSARDYEDEIEYLVSSGVVLDVKSISNPVFPLVASARKNLVKLYMNDVGLLSNVLFHTNISAIKDDLLSINLGSVYETVVATELLAHGHPLFYYDNKQKGEVDFMIDDYDSLSILPIEVKSGKDYTIHRALDRFVGNPDYKVKTAVVLSNEAAVTQQGPVLNLPIYYSMFL